MKILILNVIGFIHTIVPLDPFSPFIPFSPGGPYMYINLSQNIIKSLVPFFQDPLLSQFLHQFLEVLFLLYYPNYQQQYCKYNYHYLPVDLVHPFHLDVLDHLFLLFDLLFPIEHYTSQ